MERQHGENIVIGSQEVIDNKQVTSVEFEEELKAKRTNFFLDFNLCIPTYLYKYS